MRLERRKSQNGLLNLYIIIEFLKTFNMVREGEPGGRRRRDGRRELPLLEELYDSSVLTTFVPKKRLILVAI